MRRGFAGGRGARGVRCARGSLPETVLVQLALDLRCGLDESVRQASSLRRAEVCPPIPWRLAPLPELAALQAETRLGLPSRDIDEDVLVGSKHLDLADRCQANTFELHKRSSSSGRESTRRQRGVRD